MKPTLLISLLLFLLLTEVQGIRFDLGLQALLGHKRINEDKSKLIEIGATGVVEEAAKPDNGQHSGSHRRLIAGTTTTSVSGVAKSEKSKVSAHAHSEHKESFTINSPPAPKHEGATKGKLPDVIDLTGMDYSPARRKPPIHN